MKLFSIISSTFLLHICISAGGLGALEDVAANNNEAIRMASQNGHLRAVKNLLSRPGVDPTANNNEAIRLASECGRIKVVKELLSRPGVDPTAINNLAIRSASRNGRLEIVKELLSRPGVDPTADDNQAIRLASECGRIKVVKELLSRPGVDPTAINNLAIRSASRNGRLEIVKELLSRPGVDPTADDNQAIRLASENGHLEVVRYLLSLPGVNPSAHNNEAIRYASRNGRLEVVKLLLSSPQVDPSALESQSLEWAAHEYRYEVVKLLIKDGRVDPTINNLALFAKVKQWSQNPSLKRADRKTVSEIKLLLQQNQMARSILFLQSQQQLTPTRFLEMINFERAWIHDSYFKSILQFPQVTELLSGIIGIDLAAAAQITTLKQLNEEIVQLMKSLDGEMNYQRTLAERPKSSDMNDQQLLELGRKLDFDDRKPLSLVSRKRWDFLWRYFGALREYSEEKIALKKKGTGVVREDVELVDNARDPFAKTAKDKEAQEDNASRFNYLTVWKLQNMVALPAPLELHSKKRIWRGSF